MHGMLLMLLGFTVFGWTGGPAPSPDPKSFDLTVADDPDGVYRFTLVRSGQQPLIMEGRRIKLSEADLANVTEIRISRQPAPVRTVILDLEFTCLPVDRHAGAPSQCEVRISVKEGDAWKVVRSDSLPPLNYKKGISFRTTAPPDKALLLRCEVMPPSDGTSGTRFDVRATLGNEKQVVYDSSTEGRSAIYLGDKGAPSFSFECVSPPEKK